MPTCRLCAFRGFLVPFGTPAGFNPGSHMMTPRTGRQREADRAPSSCPGFASVWGQSIAVIAPTYDTVGEGKTARIRTCRDIDRPQITDESFDMAVSKCAVAEDLSRTQAAVRGYALLRPAELKSRLFAVLKPLDQSSPGHEKACVASSRARAGRPDSDLPFPPRALSLGTFLTAKRFSIKMSL